MLRFTLFLFLGLFALACNSSSKGSGSEYKLDYTVDTLRIDSKDHLFYLAHNIPAAKLSPDERYLYFYDGYMHSMDQVDLEKREYVSTIQLDSDGPKGVLTRLQMDYIPKANGNLYFFTQRNFIELDPKGNLVYESASLESMFEVASEKRFYDWAKLSQDLNFLFGLSSSWKQKQMLGWIDLRDSNYNEISLDSMSYRDDLKIKLDNGATVGSLISAEYLDNKIIVSHADGIDVYKLNPDTKEKRFIDNYPQLIDRRKPGNYPKSGKFLEVLPLKSLEINYGELVFDEVNKKYYRIANKKRENQAEYVPAKDKYLLIFDENLTLIHEEDISDLDFQYSQYFVRAGKLYFFQNQNDELEFLVFDLKLEPYKE